MCAALEEHTVIVTSNVKDRRNASNHFYNVLGQELDLSQGQWKVAVKKVIYLNSFLNIIDESITLCTKQEWKSIRHKLLFPKYGGFTVSTLHHEDFTLNVKCKTNGDWGVSVKPIAKVAIGVYKYKITVTDKKGNEVLFGDGTWVGEMEPFTYDMEYIERRGYVTEVGDAVPLTPDDLDTVKVDFQYIKEEEYTISAGNYENISSLISTLNAMGLQGIKFSIGSRGYVEVSIESNIDWISLNKDLDLTLGFNERKLLKSCAATHLPQMNRGRFAFFIYSNIVNNTRVGDMHVPLLDVVSIPRREFAEIVSLDVVNPLYSTVSMKRIHEIEIMLASDSGELIKFDNTVGNAKTLLVLHFIRVI